MAKSMLGLAAVALLGAAAFLRSPGYAAEAPATKVAASANASNSDWPQYCGPNRDNVAVNSPKLLDAWPKDGPPLLWKSEWIPGWTQGGAGGPAVADGKVFVYATAKNPVGGGAPYKLITPEVLDSAGWMAGLPDDLAKKIEGARTSPSRPNCHGWAWWEIKDSKAKEKELDAYLAKKPELDKYIKDFVATLKPEEAGKYGAFIKKRLCITPRTNVEPTWYERGIEWDGLVRLSKLQSTAFPTLREWARELEKATGDDGKPSLKSQQTLADHMNIGRFLASAWNHCFTRSDALTCVDATTGKTVWKKDFPLDAEVQAKLDGAYAYVGLCGTPAIADGKCYFGGAMGLYCLAEKDGAPIWQAKCPPSHTSALVANGAVYYCGTAYNAATGQVLWKTPLWKHDISEWHNSTPPSLWKSGAKTYLLASDSYRTLCCLDMETGKDVWTLPLKNTDYGPAGYAVRSDSDILMAEGKLYRMTPTALQPLEIVGGDLAENMVSAGLLHQGHFYTETGGGHSHPKVEGLCCWDFNASDKNVTFTMKWNSQHVWSWYAPPIVADGKIILANGPGGGQEDWIYNNFKVIMIKETSERYTPLGSFDPNMIPWTPLALAGGKLFVRTEVGISCYNLAQH